MNAFSRFDTLIKSVPPDYIDQNRPEIVVLLQSGATRARNALAALSR